MSDSTINRFLASGTAAAMALYTPNPPTVASGPDCGVMWYQTDTGATYSWDGAAWVLVSSGGSPTPDPSATVAALDGEEDAGASDDYSRGDHKHALEVRTADPGAPVDDTWWVVRDGGTPEAVDLKVRIGGVTYVLASITI